MIYLYYIIYYNILYNINKYSVVFCIFEKCIWNVGMLECGVTVQ